MSIDPRLEIALRQHIAAVRAHQNETPYLLKLPTEAHEIIKKLAAEHGQTMHSLLLDLIAEGIEPLERKWKTKR